MGNMLELEERIDSMIDTNITEFKPPKKDGKPVLKPRPKRLIESCTTAYPLMLQMKEWAEASKKITRRVGQSEPRLW